MIAVWAIDLAAQGIQRQGYDIEYDRYVQQWMSCFESAQSIDVSLKACNSALSYRYQLGDDRAKLLQRRAALVKQWEQLTAQESINDSIDVPRKNGQTSQRAVGAPQGNAENRSVRSFDLMMIFPIMAVIAILCAMVVVVVSLWRPGSTGSDRPGSDTAAQMS
jgi:hypothetical protein